MDEQLRSQLLQAQQGLTVIHKVLVEHERQRYERVYGRQSPGELLQLLLNNPFFGWLRELSGIISEIDTYLNARTEQTVYDGSLLLDRAERLLKPLENGKEFEHQYWSAIQLSPEVALAHAQWKRLAATIWKPAR